MKILLDTHILLWTLADDIKLPTKARKLIENGDNEIFFSILSLWEIELKHLSHPNEMKISSEDIAVYCGESGFIEVPIKKAHIYALESLKYQDEKRIHKDPFDRLLVCHASKENMLFITHDSRIGKYDDPCILLV